MKAQLDTLVRELERQTAEVEGLIEPLTDEQFFARTAEGRWSVAEHLTHLGLANRPYVGAIGQELQRARSRGWTAEGPYRGGWLVGRLVRSMEPPVTRRVRTFKRLEPAPRIERGSVMAEFEGIQQELGDLIQGSEGLDLGRAKVRSPFFKLLRMSVIQAYEFLAAHNRRHIWHVRQIIESNDARGGGPSVGADA